MGPDTSIATPGPYFESVPIDTAKLRGSFDEHDFFLLQSGIVSLKTSINTHIGYGFLVQLPIYESSISQYSLITTKSALNNDDNDCTTFHFSIASEMDTNYSITLSPDRFCFQCNFADIALVEVTPDDCPNAQFLSFAHVPRNSKVCTIKNPGSASATFHQGVYTTDWGYKHLHNIPIEPVSQGVPLFNVDRQVIGMCLPSLDGDEYGQAVSLEIFRIAIDSLLHSNSEKNIGFRAPRQLRQSEIDELIQHGLEQITDTLFLSPASSAVTPLWFIRTHYAWYWTPTSPEKSISLANWSIINSHYPVQAIGGMWDSVPPAERNQHLIKWLISTKTELLL